MGRDEIPVPSAWPHARRISMPRLLLRIDPVEAASGWRAEWSVDGRSVGRPFSVEGAAAGTMADLGRRFLELFGGEGRPLAEPEALRALGRGLFETWFAPAWPAVSA